MKIKIFTYLLMLVVSFSIQAKVEKPVVPNEIIGSGIIGVNSTRAFTIDTDTLLYKDKQPINYETFEIIGSGYKTSFTVIDDVNTEVDSGTVNALELITDISGPVTSVSPLMVLEQPVLITSDTVNSISSGLQVGTLLSLSGFVNNNKLKATKVMSHNSGQNWKIRGTISQINSATIDIGNLSIGTGTEQLINCNVGYANGDLVEVIMLADSNYQPGLTIDSISIECLSLNQLNSQDMLIPSVLQGFVSRKRGLSFWLDEVEVVTSQNTLYENGEKRFVEEGVNVEVQGVLNTQTSKFTVDSVRFLDTRIAITFPLEPQDITVGESIVINGKIYDKTPFTRDSVVLNNGLSSAKQVEIDGFIDSDGNAYISKVLNKGRANDQRIAMRGSIENVNKPIFSLLNFQIDTSNSLLINTGSGVLDVDAFFALIAEGSQVEIRNAAYDSMLNQITGGEITIRMFATKQQAISTKEIIGSGIVGGFVNGTVTSVNNNLFDSSFEQ